MLKAKIIKNWLVILFLICLILPAVWSLFKPGFFTSHDGEWMVVRFSAFHQALRDGQLPVRWAGRLNHEFGYPIFDFLYPLPFYLAEAFHLIGFSFVNSVKAVFIISFFLSGFFMYWWISRKWGRIAGLTSAAFYLWTPYRFLDVYVRGSLGEATAFIFPPLIFLSFEKLRQRQSSFWLSIGALAYAGLITSHNTMAMLFTGVIIFYLLSFSFTLRPNLNTLYLILNTLLLGLGLSAFFWLPAIWDKQYTILSKTLISCFFCHFPTLRQLIIPSWGFSPSLPLTDKETMSFQLGIWNLIVVLLVLFYFLLKLFRKKKDCFRRNWEAVYFLIIFLAAVFLMLPISSLVWKLLLVYNFIQFPWRLLAITVFASSLLSGFIIGRLREGKRLATGLIFILGITATSFSYTHPQAFTHRSEGFYTTNEDSTTVSAEYTPVWVKKLPKERPNKKVEILKGEGRIENLTIRSNKILFRSTSQEPVYLKVNLHWFPGWQVLVDGKKQTIKFKDDGLIKFSLTPGEHSITVNFKETPLRLGADFVSLASFIIVIGLWRKKIRSLKL